MTLPDTNSVELGLLVRRLDRVPTRKTYCQAPRGSRAHVCGSWYAGEREAMLVLESARFLRNNSN